MMMRRLQEVVLDGMNRAPLVPRLLIRPGPAGFFGELFTMINGLRRAELGRMRARVHWGASSPYFDPGRSSNAWTSYFAQADFDFSDGRKGISVPTPYRPGAHDFIPYPGMSVRQSATQALHAWCQPQAEILAAVADIAGVHSFGQRPILGAHIRRTDVLTGAEGRTTVDLEAFDAAIETWLAAHRDGAIFLATDDARVEQRLARMHGDRLIAQDCLRSPDGTSIHGHYDRGVAGSPYQKGRGVLVDALLLARCSFLLCTHSRVTTFVRCWNPDLACRDLEVELLGVDRTPWLRG